MEQTQALAREHVRRRGKNLNVELDGLFAVDYSDMKILVTDDLSAIMRKPDSECILLQNGNRDTPCFYDVNINGATMSIKDVVVPSQHYVNKCMLPGLFSGSDPESPCEKDICQGQVARQSDVCAAYVDEYCKRKVEDGTAALNPGCGKEGRRGSSEDTSGMSVLLTWYTCGNYGSLHLDNAYSGKYFVGSISKVTVGPPPRQCPYWDNQVSKARSRTVKGGKTFEESASPLREEIKDMEKHIQLAVDDEEKQSLEDKKSLLEGTIPDAYEVWILTFIISTPKALQKLGS